MTLKEKVAEVEPDAIGNAYSGGVSHCPYHYDFLNITLEECRSICESSKSYDTCDECWNREFVNNEEVSWVLPSSKNVSTESKLRQIAQHLDSKSYFSVEFSNGKWYIECWTDCKLRMIHNGFVDDLDNGLDDVIEKLGGGLMHE